MERRPDNYSHIIPNIKDWPITQFSDNREQFIKRLIDFTMQRLDKSNSSVFELLSKTIYLETKRVKLNPWQVDPGDEHIYWDSLQKELENTLKAPDPAEEQRKIMRRLVNRYSEEIIGYFEPRIFKFTRIFSIFFFKRLFNNGWGRGHSWIWGNKQDLLKKVKVDGHVEDLRKLFNKGTVVIVPTHYSNLDSLLIGFGIDFKICIPAFSYGAGLNLYDYELFAYFMNRLGAYRVDRRKKNPVYLETLKNMASLSLTEGLNHIFFPGGTRSRSGAIENKLKLGLLNSVIDAQRHCILNDIHQKMFVVPLSIGYHFVLEASSLIDQHLKITGREKYTRREKQKSFVKKIIRFFFSMRNYDSEVYLSVGQPMDVLGNRVDAEGQSYDERGNPLSIDKYFSTEDVPNQDPQRESVYTKILADRIVHSFKTQNIVLSSHLLAFVLFTMIREENPELSLFAFFNINTKDVIFPIDDLIKSLAYYQEILRERASRGEAKLSEAVQMSPMECFKDGIRNIGIYHSKKVIYLKGKKHVGTEDLRLLYYYHNKMEHYELPVKQSSVDEMLNKQYQ